MQATREAIAKLEATLPFLDGELKRIALRELQQAWWEVYELERRARAAAALVEVVLPLPPPTPVPVPVVPPELLAALRESALRELDDRVFLRKRHRHRKPPPSPSSLPMWWDSFPWPTGCRHYDGPVGMRGATDPVVVHLDAEMWRGVEEWNAPREDDDGTSPHRD
jgi:hypothetical protein